MCAQNSGKIFFAACEFVQVLGIASVSDELDTIRFKKRCLSGKLAGFLVLIRNLPGCDFAGLNVRLIKSVDAEDGSGNRRSDFPAEEFLANIVDISHINGDYGLTRFLQRIESGLLRVI